MAMPELGDAIDGATLSQILEMDDEGTHDFSKDIVYDFFDQAHQTFTEIDDAM